MKKLTILFAVFAILLAVPAASALNKSGSSTVLRGPGDEVRP